MSPLSRIIVSLCIAILGVWWLIGDGADGGQGVRARSRYHSGAAYLKGAVVLDDEIPGPYVQVEIACRFGPGEGDVVRKWIAATAERRFVVDQLPAGEATISFGVGNLDEPIAVLENVTIPASGPVLDERLAGVDLRGRLNVFAFRAFDPDGVQLGDAMIGYRAAGTERYTDEVELVEGVATIVSPYPLLDLVVLAPGLRFHEEQAVSQSGELVLREGVPVQLALPAEIDPARDSIAISVRLVRAEPEPRVAGSTRPLENFLAESGEYTFRGTEDLELTLDSPGVYEVQWRMLEQDGSDSWQPLQVGQLAPARIEVEDTYEGQRFVLALPLAAYRRALEGR
ncbi:MAG: hypothetical protein GY711_19590 [bacterium]|nr:hypothetical protein [bacterium]